MHLFQWAMVTALAPGRCLAMLRMQSQTVFYTACMQKLNASVARRPNLSVGGTARSTATWMHENSLGNALGIPQGLPDAHPGNFPRDSQGFSKIRFSGISCVLEDSLEFVRNALGILKGMHQGFPWGFPSEIPRESPMEFRRESIENPRDFPRDSPRDSLRIPQGHPQNSLASWNSKEHSRQDAREPLNEHAVNPMSVYVVPAA